jgi:Putative zinc-finger
MIESCAHEESWLLLPWLANGRLSPAQRARVEDHLRECAPCARELAQQRLMCEALSGPERVTYAPGPSFRKLMERIDGREGRTRQRPPALPASPPPVAALARSAWRPPGLAWAASFLLMLCIGALAPTAYRWSQPLYTTHTAAPPGAPHVLHVAFVPSLSVAEVGELLRSAGAHVVEGPDPTGIVGVVPEASGTAGGAVAGDAAGPGLQTLAARLRSDARVRWVEPIAAGNAAGGNNAAGATGERHPAER